MIQAWTASDVRAAEEPLLAAGDPLMARAAHALAAAVVRDVARRRPARPARPPRLRGGLGTDGLPGEATVRAVRPSGGARDAARGARAVLLVGSGNNGGDTLFAGAHLVRRGLAVTAVVVTPSAHEEGLAAFRAAGGTVVGLYETRVPAVVEQVRESDVVVDGLVGIGSRGALRPPAGGLVRALADARREAESSGAGWPWVVAVDIPSGIGVDDGTLPGPVLPADRTVTFGALKPGLVLPPAVHLAGEVEVVDLGLRLGARRPGTAGAPGRGASSSGSVKTLDGGDAAALLRVPGPRDHKYTRGVVGVVAGTAAYPGAGVLATSAAVRAGAGMVRYLGPAPVSDLVLARRPEVVTAGGRVQSWVLGPGIPAEGDDDGQHRRVFGALAAVTGVLSADVTGGAVPAVLDAGAIDLLEHRCPAFVVLTPHAGELAALLTRVGHDADRAAVEAEPLRWVRVAHEATGATVLLKGSVTVVVGPGGTFAQADGPAWLATAGTGDVFAGLLGTLLAARCDEVLARPALAAELAAAAALVHGRAGWIAARKAGGGGEGPIVALDVAEALPTAIAEVLAGV
ncbi:bifunctional ADP-dependent NAD(P)H-hydrate dehydratase/NAD(P)H-hydrate epimerase [Antribacter gilvus]|uniref:bifunctional ADP-dependent NAD(P)H-hydrate dehydratase/NAD(P)H-hydrate epimerase n=1 Tax=Antribacter gilvus TaxID=2304675 RepID=UPI000F774DB2|nr:bifunctional ADP-dependent NAD(P)H-hydrate dehydratase/NAD(P)H-hydrate epimerase [Antribacter gilvus]